jgi:hypothetical protein
MSKYSSYNTGFNRKVTGHAEKHANKVASQQFIVPEFNMQYGRNAEGCSSQKLQKAFQGL